MLIVWASSVTRLFGGIYHPRDEMMNDVQETVVVPFRRRVALFGVKIPAKKGESSQFVA
jgi:hypothetical protein